MLWWWCGGFYYQFECLTWEWNDSLWFALTWKLVTNTCTVTTYSRGEIIVEWRREREEFVKPDQREISMTLCWIIDAPILNLVPETHSGLSCYCLVLKLPFQSESHSCKGILIIRMIKSHPMNIIIPIWRKK